MTNIEPISNERFVPSSNESPKTAANYIAVDTMQNSFGPSSNTINPLYYDPISGVVAVVHRGRTTYAVGSGELWWNWSTDYGSTWTRSETSVQNGVIPILARYPSMAIWNPNASTNLSEILGVFSWPELVGNAFGGLGWGVSEGLLQSSLASIIQPPPLYSSNVPTFVNANYACWTSDNQDDASLKFFRTNDFLNIDSLTPPTWSSSRFGDNGNIQCGGISDENNNLYVGIIASFTEEIGAGGWEIGYSKSTDDGATWSDWSIPDWRQISVTADYDRLWDWKLGDAFVSYSGDITVDASGLVHLVTGLTDTNTSRNAIVEFFETAPGVWDAKIIADGNEVHDLSNYSTNDPGIGQTGPSIMIARNATGDFFTVQWTIGSPTSPNSNNCDIYIKTRALNDAAWSSATNLTQTDNMNEDGCHLAQYLATTTSGGSTTDWLFSMYWYEAGNTTDSVNNVNPTVVYVATVPVRVVSSIGDNSFPVSFELAQNYPNPFNPSTNIKYSIAERSNVTIKVYDMLGSEVATLVNQVQDAGTHNVVFNASNLASGMYVYTINAGNFTATKKMMLLK
ncbi:T9SS type A sorting domain-containing protein [Ignavibacterium album]|uniref:T9SS type A sorting domain-containing protein n=1 Tax=Ignavibacterium album TaxID=591197 RepID=UPI00143AF66D|nr:T9SS type A sorting domain-containing protein [Ignavibacterium album]